MSRFFQVFLALLLLAGALPRLAACAKEPTPDTRTLCPISDMGDRTVYPENSLPALLSAEKAGAELIRIPLQKTADGAYILSKDETLERMCGADSRPIAEMTLAEIAALRLHAATGGDTARTEEAPVPLDTALREVKTPLLLDFDWAERDGVYRAAENAGRLETVVFVCRTGAKEALAWRDAQTVPVKIMVYKKTNIIFSALSAARALRDQEGAYLWLATANPYGVIFSSAVTNAAAQTDGLALCLTDGALCGGRTDTDSYRDDAVSRGYNMLMTADMTSLSAYQHAGEQARDALSALLAEENTRVLPDFKGSGASEYRFAYQNALIEARRLSLKAFAGEQECRDAENALRTAAAAIDENYRSLTEGTAGQTLTPGRLLVVLIAVPVFVALELFFYKYREKKKKTP